MYNTTQDYKDKILNDSTQHELNIYIDNNKIEPNHIIDFKSTLELFNNNEFCLGSTPEIDIEFEIDRRDLPESYNEVHVESGLEDEIIPIGKFTIQSIEDDEFKVKIKATDYMKKFDDNKYDGSDLTYPATMLQVLQDICTKIGVELGSTSFLNDDKQIAVYDNTVTARTYIGYIAEQAGGFAVIGRDGKLYIKTFGEDTANIDINLFDNFKWGDKFSVSKVSYEDGTQNYKFGDETASTVYINQNNMYIVDSEQIENIYNQIKDFEVYSFEGETIIDPAYDIGDILIIDGKKVIYQGELEYAGKFKANIKSKIQAKTEQESMQTKSNSSEKIRRVQSEINQIDGKIEQLVEETSDQSQKLTKVEQTVDSISQKVSDIEDLTRTAEEVKTVTLENCIEANLLELHIYGNNTVFDYITLDDDLVLSDDLYLQGDSLITVTDKDENKVEYELNVQEPLRQNSEVCDEFILENGQAKVIRRINKSGSTKAKESVEDLGKLEIPLKEGTNTITINNYTARIKAKYVIKSTYSDTFASRVEMNSAITQNSEKIMSEVNKKVDETELGTKIEQNAEAVKFAWNQISEFIQMMIIDGNASLAILDKNKKVLMALDKVGQHFYNSDKTMDIGAFDCYFPSYDNTFKSLMFALNEKATNNFMAWGYKTTAENGDITYTPVVYLGGNSDEDYGFHVENDIILNFNKIRLKKSKIYDNNDSLCFEIGEDLFYGDTRDNKEIFSVYNNSTGTKTFRLFGDDNSPIMIDSDGNLVLANGKIILDNNGNIDCVHLYQTGDSSDIRIKNNIKDSSESAINIINKIHHKEFDKKDDNTHYKIGYIAQEMEQIDKNFVVKKHANKEKGVEERYYINQLPILATVTKAIQEQQAQIEELKKEIETLKGAKE